MTVIVAVGALAVVTARPAVAVTSAGATCRADEDGAVRLDVDTGITLLCSSDSGGRRWRETAAGTRSADLESTPRSGSTTTTVPTGAPAPGGRGWPAVASPRAPHAGGRCDRAGERAVDPGTGELLGCTDAGAGARRWARLTPGSQRTTTTAPVPSTAVPITVIIDPLPYDLGNPTGLPPNVALPPGAVARAGSPMRLPSDEWFKRNRWMTASDVPGTDPEAVTTWFAAQCAAIGWIYDPATVERLPTSPPANPTFDRSVRMTLGECRTPYGSPADPSRRRPWYLSWSATLRNPALGTLEVVTELRSTSRIGGRQG